MKTWPDAVREAIKRICSAKNSNSFTRQEILQFELGDIEKETETHGRTPEQTLSRTLQELRDMGEIEFRGQGKYELRIGIPNIDSERKANMYEYNSDNTPNPSKFLESYRYLGYSNYSAIADLIDNGFDAGADNIWVTTERLDTNNFKITISDDGSGMDEKILEQAFRLGAITERNPEKDLGKYGVGSASATLSLGRKTIVITKTDVTPCLLKILDLDHMIKNNSFMTYLGEAGAKEIKLFVDMTNNSPTGTCVIIENCDNIRSKTNIVHFNNQLRKHLGQTFRYFLSAGKRIYLNSESIPSIDPLLLDGFSYRDVKYETRVYSDEYYDLKILDEGDPIEEKVRIRIVILPEMDRALLKERWPKYVQQPSLQSQGFYVLRNNREIASGEKIIEKYTKHNDFNRFRGEIFFTGRLDSCMGVNFTKRKLDITQSMHDQLETYLKDQLESVRKAIKRDRVSSAEETQESFRESETVIEQKKNLLIKKKQTEEEIKKEVEDLKKKQPTKTPEQIEQEQKKFLDEAGKPKDVHFDLTNMGKTGPFFDTEKLGRTLIIKFNVDHPFYYKFYNEKDKSTQNAINFMIYSLVLAKRHLNDEQVSMMEQIEVLWSTNLRSLLD
jgi:hypothetical protein